VSAWPNLLGRGTARQAVAWTLAATVHVGVFLLAGVTLIEPARFAVQIVPPPAVIELAAWPEPVRTASAPSPSPVIPIAPAPPPAPEPAPVRANDFEPSPLMPAVEPPPAAPVPSPPTPDEVPPLPSPRVPAAPPARAPSVGHVPSQAIPAAATAPVAPPRACPDYERNPPPPYPRSARRLGLEGAVLLEVRVSARGTVEGLRVQQSSGYAVLDQAALKAVKGWRFRPALAGAVPIPWTVEVPVRFTLD